MEAGANTSTTQAAPNMAGKLGIKAPKDLSRGISEREAAEMLTARQKARAEEGAEESEQPVERRKPPREERAEPKKKPEPEEADDADGEEGAQGDEAEGDEEEIEAASGDEGEGDAAEGEDDDVLHIKVNGKIQEISGKKGIEIISKFLANKENLEDFKVKEKEFTERQTQMETFHEDAKKNLHQLAQMLLHNLQGDQRFTRENLERLREEDPGEYAATMRDYDAKRESLKATQDYFNKEQQRLAKEHEAKVDAWRSKQTEELTRRYKEFKDPKIRHETLSATADYLATLGFTKEELDNTYDARIWDAGIRLLKSHQAESSLADTLNQVKKAAKLAKPGVRSGEGAKAGLEREYRKVSERAKQTGSHKDAARLLGLRQQMQRAGRK